MLVAPASLWALMARLRKEAMVLGVAGADAGAVFVAGDVADPVQAVFDVPVAADEGVDAGGVGVGSDEVGDSVGDLVVVLAAAVGAGECGKRAWGDVTVHNESRPDR